MIKQPDLIYLEDYQEENWTIGLAFCVICRKGWGCRVHRKTDIKKLECPYCKSRNSMFINGQIIFNILEYLRCD